MSNLTPIRMASMESEDAVLSEYAASFKAAKLQLRTIWADLEMGEESAKSELERISAKANDVWSEAVASARLEQQELCLSIDEAIREARSIQEELGQIAAEGEDQEEGATSALTTHARFEKAKRELDMWRARKAKRLELLEAVHSELSHLRDLLGLTSDSAQTMVAGISDSSLENLRNTIQQLKSEQAQRFCRLKTVVKDMQSLCGLIAEKCETHVLSVHASLANVRLDSGEVMCDDGVDGINLSDGMFRGLEKKMDSLKVMRDERDAQVGEVESQIQHLWEQLGMHQGNVDREIIVKLLASEDRLKPETFAKCDKERVELEVKKAQKTYHTIRLKHEELSRLASEAHLEVPHVGEQVHDLASGPAKTDPMAYVHKVEETLARVQQGIESVKAAAERRVNMLAMIGDIQDTLEDVQWLNAYENDVDRFKGRDSTRNVQKSIRLQKVRAQLPAMLDELVERLGNWEDFEGEEFLYDGIPYKSHLMSLRETCHTSSSTKASRQTAHSGRSVPKHSPSPATPATRRLSAGATRASPVTNLSASVGRARGKPEAPPLARKAAGRPSSASSPSANAQPLKTAKRNSGRPATASARMSDEEKAAIMKEPAPRRPAVLTTTAKELQEQDINSPGGMTEATGNKAPPTEMISASGEENCAPCRAPDPVLRASLPSKLVLPGKKSMLKAPAARRLS